MPMRPAAWCRGVWGCALAVAVATGCGGSATSAPDGGDDAAAQDGAVAEDAAGRAVIEIYVEGDPTAKTFTDGYSGQTPRDYVMGLQRFDLLRSSNDPTPVTVFDYGPGYTEVDMSTKTLVGVGRTPDIPAGSYSHARVLLAMARFTVNASAHSGSLGLPGAITATSALSDTIIDGTPFTKGQCQFEFVSGSITNTLGGALPPLPATAGGTIVDDGQRTWMVFPFAAPLAVDPGDAATHQATITYETFESFRWEEQALTGYTTGVWDVNADFVSSEVVKNFGATGYRVETL